MLLVMLEPMMSMVPLVSVYGFTGISPTGDGEVDVI